MSHGSRRGLESDAPDGARRRDASDLAVGKGHVSIGLTVLPAGETKTQTGRMLDRERSPDCLGFSGRRSGSARQGFAVTFAYR